MLKNKSNCKNQDLWVTSYADLVTAILSVLILIVSFSKIDIEKYDMVQKLMIEKKEKKYKMFSTLKDVKQRIEQKAKKYHLEDKVDVKLNKNGLIVNFDSAAQFKTAQFKLKKDAKVLMKPIFEEIVKESQYRYIEISGYTDDVPGRSMTNWELSSLRALSIQKALESMGLNNDNVQLIANANNTPLISYKDKSGNDLKYAREKNRRVSIVIQDVNFKNLENSHATKP